MTIQLNYPTSFYVKKIHLKKCIKNNHKITLQFDDISYNDIIVSRILIKNIKNREEFTCPFTLESTNTLTIDLSNLWTYFTDYEGTIIIDIKLYNKIITLIPILTKNPITIVDDDSKNSNFKWFVRTIDNGELRFSSIINSKH